MKTSSRVLIGLSAVFLASCSSGGMHHDASAAPLAQEVRRVTESLSGRLGGHRRRLRASSSAASAARQVGAMGIHYVNGDLVGDGKIGCRRAPRR